MEPSKKKLKPKDVNPETYKKGWTAAVTVLEQWSSCQSQILDCEKRLEKLRARSAALEESFPFLGNVRGVVKTYAARVGEASAPEPTPVPSPDPSVLSPIASSKKEKAERQNSVRKRLEGKLKKKSVETTARQNNPEFIRHTADEMEAEN